MNNKLSTEGAHVFSEAVDFHAPLLSFSKNMLTEKPRWEKLVDEKLTEAMIHPETREVIIQGIEGFVPLLIILVVGYFGFKSKD